MSELMSDDDDETVHFWR